MAWGLQHISSRELAEWREYYKLEPFGQDVTQKQLAAIACILRNSGMDVAEGKRKPFTIDDFMVTIRPQEEEKVQTDEDVLAYLDLITAFYGGKERKK